MNDYLRDPTAIEAASFAAIRAATDLSGLDLDAAQVALRLVHACGDPAVVERLALENDPVAAGVAAVRAGAPVLCDVEMVRHGLTRRYLHGEVRCHLNDPGVAEAARRRGWTRTMAAVDHWDTDGAVVVVGNAPTALFRLLERLREGAPAPRLLVAMPVGFIGAAESKAAARDHARAHGLPLVTLHGRVGGSALACAAVNAIARLAAGERW